MNSSATLNLMKSVSDLISDSRLIYKGRFDYFPKDAKLGDVIIKDGSEYIFTDKWEEIGIFASAPNSHEITATTSIYPKLCTQCGAPLHGSICIFCDTEYY